MSSLTHIQPVCIENQETARSRWFKLDSENVARSPFTDFDFLDGLAALFGWSVKTIFWAEHLGARFVVRKRFGSLDVVVPPLSPYSCISLSSSLPEEHAQKLLRHLFLPQKHIPRARLISIDPRLVSSIRAPGMYNRLERKTFQLATSSIDEALSGFSEGTRRNFKRHRDQYVFQVGGISTDQIAVLVSEAYRHRKLRMSLPASVLGLFGEGLVEKRFATSVGVYDCEKGILAAGILLLIQGDTAWYWMSGSQRGPAMTVLITHTIDYLHREGIKYFDLMGANTPGITDFKRRFGPATVTYAHFSCQTAATKAISGMGATLKRARHLLTR